MGFLLGLTASIAVIIAANILNMDRQAAWLATFAVFWIDFVVIGWVTRGDCRGIFINNENRISLARFQLILWSTIVLSALFASGLQNLAGSQPDPLDIAIPESIWGLLGLGSFTWVASSEIASGMRGKQPLITNKSAGQESWIENGIVVKADGHARWLDLVTGEGTQAGQADIAKLQKLCITLLLACVYFADLYVMFGAELPVRAFPTVSGGMVALIGISHATFLANKQFSALRYKLDPSQGGNGD